jgi:LytS/YehU family sensor histidine kinase
LIRTKKNTDAENYILHYSKLLRKIFEIRDQQVIPFKEEIALLKEYIAVENLRFQGKIKLSVTAKLKQAGALTPPLLLQPLVENAIKHGFKPGTELLNPQIKVKIIEKTAYTEVSVCDNGVGYSQDLNGISLTGGLALTRKRVIEFNYNFLGESEMFFDRRKLKNSSEYWTEVRFKLDTRADGPENFAFDL